MLKACIDKKLSDEITQCLILKFFHEHRSLTDAQKSDIALDCISQKINDFIYSNVQNTAKMTELITTLSLKITDYTKKEKILSEYLIKLLSANVDDTNIIESVIKAGANVNYYQAIEYFDQYVNNPLIQILSCYKQTPLTCAVKNKNSFDVIQLLIKKGACVAKAEAPPRGDNCKSSSYRYKYYYYHAGNREISLLYYAFKNKLSDEIVELLIKQGANVNFVHTEYQYSVEDFEVHRGLCILKNGWCLLKENREPRSTLTHILSYAIEQRASLKSIQALIDKGADIVQAEKDSKSLIMRALDRYQGEELNKLMKILVDNSAVIERGKKYQDSIFGRACSCKVSLEVIKLLFQHKKPSTDEIWGYAIFSHPQAKEVLQWLIENDVAFNASIFNGACSCGASIETIKSLLKHAKPLTDKISGDDIFSHPQWKEVLQLLARNNVKFHNAWLLDLINDKDARMDMIDFLIENGVNVNDKIKREHYSLTPLQHICELHKSPRDYDIEIIRKLIAAGADIEYEELLYAWQSFPEAYQAFLMSRRCPLENCINQEKFKDFCLKYYSHCSRVVNKIINDYKEQKSSLAPVIQDLKKVATCKKKMQQLYTLIFSPEVSKRIASDVSTTKGTFFSLEEINKRIEESTDQFNNHFFSRIARILKIDKEHDKRYKILHQAINILEFRGYMDLKNSFLVNALHYFYIHLSKTSPEECQQEVARVDQLLDNMESKGLLASRQHKICADFYQALAKDKRENKDFYLDQYLERNI